MMPVGGLASNRDDARCNSAKRRQELTRQSDLARLTDEGWHPQTFIRVNGDSDIRIGSFDVGQSDPKVCLGKGELLLRTFS
jgi:hypothetical protein